MGLLDHFWSSMDMCVTVVTVVPALAMKEPALAGFALGISSCCLGLGSYHVNVDSGVPVLGLLFEVSYGGEA
jgi:hypothetical protein